MGSAVSLVGVVDLSRAFGVTVGNTVDVGTTRKFAPSLSAVDCWNWSEFELEHSRAAEFHSERVLMMTTKI